MQFSGRGSLRTITSRVIARWKDEAEKTQKKLAMRNQRKNWTKEVDGDLQNDWGLDIESLKKYNFPHRDSQLTAHSRVEAWTKEKTGKV